MRLVRQYRNDRGRFALRVLLLGILLTCIYVLTSAAVSTLTTNYFLSDMSREDKALVSQSSADDFKLPIDQRIAKREKMLGRAHNISAVKHIKRQLASLYAARGKESLRHGARAAAEANFKKAISLDPANATYPHEVAELYADAATRQTEETSRLDLLKSSSDYFQQAMEKEPAGDCRHLYTDEAAGADYRLAKEEFMIPDGRSAALNDLRRAKALASPDSEVAKDIDQLVLLASN